MKTNLPCSAVSRRANATLVNQSGLLSSPTSRVPRGALRIGCAAILLLLLTVSGFSQSPPAMPNQWFPFPTNFDTGYGSPPISYTTNLISTPVDTGPFYGNLLILDTTNLTPAFLHYDILDTNYSVAHRNINYGSGTVMFYFAPNWASVTQGGTGPGAIAYFIGGGDWSSGSPNGLFQIYADAGGTNIYFGGVGAGTATTYASAPISWASNTFHQIGVEWTSDDSEIYVDGQLVAASNGLSILPTHSTWTNGVYINSDGYGYEQARGATYALYTWTEEYGAYYTNAWLTDSNALATWQGTLGGGGFGGMMGMGGLGGLIPGGCGCACVSNTTVYLTNIIASTTNGPGMTVTFTIEGGTNGLAYDVFSTTNFVGTAMTNSTWTWLGQGTNCGTYSLVNQPTNQTFYLLGTPAPATDGLQTKAYEALIHNWTNAAPNSTTAFTVTIVSPAQGAIIQ
jgi:hypothetical protein